MLLKPARFLLIKICILSLLLIANACRHHRQHDLKLAPVPDPAGPCDDLSNENGRDICEHVHLSLLREQTKATYSNLVIDYDRRFMGDPMTLSIDGHCLALVEGEVVSNPCQDLDENFKWHFVDVEVQYTWGHGVVFHDLAFHAVTRASMKRWHQHDKNTMPTPKLECIDYYDATRPYMSFQFKKLRIVPCEESNLMFLSVPNDTVGDRNLYGSRWARLVAIDKRLPQFAALRNAMQTLNPMLTQPCSPGCTSHPDVLAAWNKAMRIDLGDIKWRKDTFFLAQSEFDPESRREKLLFNLFTGDYVGQQATKLCTESDPCTKRKDNLENEIFIGGCVPHRSDGEGRCFTEARQPLISYKMLYHAVYEKNRGQVVQIRPNGDRCLLWNGEQRHCSKTKEIDKPDGDDASQFRLAIVKSPPGKTETFVQLQRVFPDKSESDKLCYDLQQKTAVPCCVDANQCNGNYGYMLAWPPDTVVPNLVYHDPSTKRDQVVPLHYCETATNTQQFLAYDCVDYVPPIWRVLRIVGDLVFLIPQLGTVPSFIIQNILCNSGEATISAAACREVAIQAMTGFADLVIDSTTASGVANVVLRMSFEQQVVRPNANLVIDLQTSPTLALVVHDVVARAAKKFAMSVPAGQLTRTLETSLKPVAEVIVRAALTQGVNGGSVTTAYTMRDIDNMIQSAVASAQKEALAISVR